MDKPTCTIPDCGKPIRAKSLCSGHYHRLNRYGDPLAQRGWYRDPAEAFKARTERQGDHLIWTGSSSAGYGHLRIDGSLVLAHRYSWEQANGESADGHEVDHICHVTLCVEPTHLRRADRRENLSNRNGAQVNHLSTGVRNVYPNTNGYQVRIGARGNRRNFGTYPTIEEAAEVAERARREVFGDYAGK